MSYWAILCYEALGQVILPSGLSALGQYHLSSGFINHNIAQNDMFYSVINKCFQQKHLHRQC